MTLKHGNPFLEGDVRALYFRTALPIIAVFLANGGYNLINAFFVGRYIGEDAISAVALAFPLQMLIFAVATLFSSGMASVVARRIGSGDVSEASRVFSNAHLMVSAVFLSLALSFSMLGHGVMGYLAGGAGHVAALGEAYISVLIYCSPILGILVLNTDALRSEGRVKVMSIVLLLSNLLNIVFDYVLIGLLDFGVAASASATVAAQTLSLAMLQWYRLRGNAVLTFSLEMGSLRRHIAEVLPLGVPMSVSHLGVALAVGAVNHALITWAAGDYQTATGAYGIVIRVMTFAILPIIGLGVSLQTILGNNYGAGLLERVNEAFRVGLASVLAYCFVVETVLLLGADLIGRAFVSDGPMAAEAAKIVRFTAAAFVLFGPVMVISSYFQAIGRAKRAIVVGLSRTYLFFLPLVLVLPLFEGEWGIWLSFPAADVSAAALAFLVYTHYSKRNGAQTATISSSQ